MRWYAPNFEKEQSRQRKKARSNGDAQWALILYGIFSHITILSGVAYFDKAGVSSFSWLVSQVQWRQSANPLSYRLPPNLWLKAGWSRGWWLPVTTKSRSSSMMSRAASCPVTSGARCATSARLWRQASSILSDQGMRHQSPLTYHPYQLLCQLRINLHRVLTLVSWSWSGVAILESFLRWLG